MATYQITAAEWTRVLGVGGTAQPGDVVELLPGTYTGQRWIINVPGDSAKPIIVKLPDDATVIFDGEYKYPAGKAAQTGPDGEMVYGGLLDIRSSGVHLIGSGRWRVVRSRGRGIVLNGDDAALKNVVVDGLEVAHCRNAGIMPRFVADGAILRCNVHHCGDYYQSPRNIDDFNWPGAIVGHQCHNLTIVGNRVHDSWTAGITVHATSGRVADNEVWDCMGNSALYLHGAHNLTAEKNLLYWSESSSFTAGTGNATGIVVNREEEFSGDVTGLRVLNNIILNMHGIGLWANEGTAAKQTDMLFAHNTLVTRNSQRCLTIRKQSGERSARFVANLLHHPDAAYGDDVAWTGIELDGNGWNQAPPADWPTTNDWLLVRLRNPDAPVSAGQIDLRNYAPVAASGDGLTTIDTPVDFINHSRTFWTVGALEYVEPTPPPPPADEIVNLIVSMRFAPGLAEELRKSLAVRGVEIVVE